MSLNLGYNVDKEEATLNNIYGEIGDGESRWTNAFGNLIARSAMDVVVKESVKLSGGLIATAERDQHGNLTDLGKAHIETAELIVEHLHDYDEGMTLGLGLTPSDKVIAKDRSGKDVENPFGNEYQMKFGHTDQKRTVRGAMGGGDIKIGKTSGAAAAAVGERVSGTSGHREAFEGSFAICDPEKAFIAFTQAAVNAPEAFRNAFETTAKSFGLKEETSREQAARVEFERFTAEQTAQQQQDNTEKLSSLLEEFIIANPDADIDEHLLIEKFSQLGLAEQQEMLSQLEEFIELGEQIKKIEFLAAGSAAGRLDDERQREVAELNAKRDFLIHEMGILGVGARVTEEVKTIEEDHINLRTRSATADFEMSSGSKELYIFSNKGDTPQEASTRVNKIDLVADAADVKQSEASFTKDKNGRTHWRNDKGHFSKNPLKLAKEKFLSNPVATSLGVNVSLLNAPDLFFESVNESSTVEDGIFAEFLEKHGLPKPEKYFIYNDGFNVNLGLTKGEASIGAEVKNGVMLYKYNLDDKASMNLRALDLAINAKAGVEYNFKEGKLKGVLQGGASYDVVKAIGSFRFNEYCFPRVACVQVEIVGEAGVGVGPKLGAETTIHVKKYAK